MAGPPSGPLAILGATSRIAQDFVIAAAARGVEFALYARRPDALRDFLAAQSLPAAWCGGTLADFGEATRAGQASALGGVLNFVGVGDPARAKEMGADIFEATRASDRLALDFVDRFPDRPYVFLSSGAVYGTDFAAPVTAESAAVIPINRLAPQDFYSVAKLHAEAGHRACADRTIVDIRVFNYISRRLDRAARFLVTDMIRAIVEGTLFETTDQPLVRDYLHPEDFCTLALACIAAPPGTNRPVDAYSRGAIDKRALLELMADAFGLRYCFVPSIAAVNATGAKPRYFSRNHSAAELGYVPTRSSADALREEIGAMLGA